MERFFEKGLTVLKLLEICQESVAKGYGNALVEVQADADGISDIMLNGFESYDNESEDPKILSLVSVTDRWQFERIYGKTS